MACNSPTTAARRNLALLFEFLCHDDRPTFFLDTDSEHLEESQPSQLMYANPAIRTFLDELAANSNDGEGYELGSFVCWATSPDLRKNLGINSNPVTFGGQRWKSSLLSGKWQGISCSSTTSRLLAPSKNQTELDFSRNSVHLSSLSSPTALTKHIAVSKSQNDPSKSPISHSYRLKRKRSHPVSLDSTVKDTLPSALIIDWIGSSLTSLPTYVRFFRDYDWASTPLGPIGNWPTQLREMVIMILANPDPRLILWGPKLSLIYNDACTTLIAQKHPASLGGSLMRLLRKYRATCSPL
ncbi:hypothetical protein AOQ84DRAFT_378090 [Glonium stellatum]|uniref:PAS-like domain-containing protein n=1 Tax=Glonium stellatum TaxID=574774 RepID=A0A8E2EY43_9PEZI|nr:hypothetical protein AOQ84DRAFT_378090 [Glonium stellatum]